MSLRERTVVRLTLTLAAFPGLVLPPDLRGSLRARLADLDELRQRFDRAPEVLTLIAAAYRKLGNDDDALRLAMQALALETSWNTTSTLGAVHRAAGRTDEAVAAFLQAASLDPTDATALMEAARTLGEASRFRGAAQLFAAVLERDGGHHEAACWRAYADWKADGAAEHVMALRQIATRHPEFVLARELLAEVEAATP